MREMTEAEKAATKTEPRQVVYSRELAEHLRQAALYRYPADSELRARQRNRRKRARAR